MPEQEIKPVGTLKPFAPVKPVGELKPFTKSDSTYSAPYQSQLSETEKYDKADSIISAIEDIDDDKKEILRDLVRKGATTPELSHAIGTLQGKIPDQWTGNYYMKEGRPIPLKRGERPPQDYDIASKWGSKKDAQDDSWYTDLAKHAFNIIPGVAENVADLGQLTYGAVTDKTSKSWDEMKNTMRQFSFPTKDHTPLYNTEGITKFSDLADSKRFDLSPDAIYGTFLQLGQSVGEMMIPAGGIAKAVKGANWAYKTVDGVNKLTTAGKVATAGLGSFLTNLSETRDIGERAGLEGRDLALFSAPVTAVMAAIDVKLGIGPKILESYTAKAEKAALLNTVVVQTLKKDATGAIEKESLDAALKEIVSEYPKVASKWVGGAIGNMNQEGTDEALQTFTQKAGEQLWDKLTPSEKNKFGESAFSPKSFGEYFSNYAAGFIGSAPGGVVSKIKDNQINEQTEKIKRDAEQSNTAFGYVQRGEEAIKDFKRNVQQELKKGNLTQDEANDAITRINSYKEYNDILGSTELKEEKKREVFDKTFQKQNLESQLEAMGDPKKLHPLKQAEYATKEKFANDLQKDINEIVLAGAVKQQTTVGNKTIDEIAKKEAKETEKPKAGTKALKYNELLTAFRDKNKTKLPPEDPRTFDELTANEYNNYSNTRVKHRKTAEWLDQQPNKKAYGKVAEKKFTWSGDKNRLNSTYSIDLGGKTLRFASSMQRPEGHRGHFMIERFKEEVPVGTPIGIKVYEIEGSEGKPPRKVIKGFRRDTGKFIGWMKETHSGTASDELSEEQRQLLGHIETVPEQEEGLFDNDNLAQGPPMIPVNDGSISKPTDLPLKSDQAQDLPVKKETTNLDVDDVKLTDDKAENRLAVANTTQLDNPQFEPNIQAVERPAENPRGVETPELTDADKAASGLVNAATGVVNMPISEIFTDEKRFQNREELDKDLVKSIAENFDENQLDPIVVWKDKFKTYVLAGHHRLEGAKQAGQKSIKVRYFNGSEAEAIDFAKVKSNANRTLESPVERAKIYREKASRGESKKSIQEAAKLNEGKNANFYLNIASLKADGPVIQLYNQFKGSEDKATQKEIDKLMDWIGEAKRQYELTDAHEQELFTFLTDKEASKKISTKADFKSKLSSIVSTLDFDREKPLNIARYKYKTEGEALYDAEMGAIIARIAATKDEIIGLDDRFGNPNNEQYVHPDDKEYQTKRKIADDKIDRLNEKLQRLEKEKLELGRQKGKYLDAGSNQESLFQKRSTREGDSRQDVGEVVKLMQKNLPKVKVSYDPNIESAGTVIDNKLLVNPYYAQVDTPIHEAGHILLAAMGNNKVVKAGIEQLKGTDFWKQVEQSRPELKGALLADEVMAQAIGIEGAGIFKEEAAKSRFKQILDYIFDWLKRNLGLEKNIAKNLARQIISGIGTKNLTYKGAEKNQIIGENAQFENGVKADLGMARHMELKGVSPKEIRALTLWERGADGKWRYEIQDDGTIIEPSKFLDYFMSVAPGQEINMGAVTDVYNFPALYNSYPGIFEGYDVILTNLQGKYAAQVDESTKSIFINAARFQRAHGSFNEGAEKSIPEGKRDGVKGDIIEKTLQLRGLRRLLGHELQHIIQKQEGFTGGSNLTHADEYLQEKYSADAKLAPGYKEAFGPEKEKFIQDYIAKQVGAPNYSEALETTYRQVAGEVEARNVQSGRFSLTPQERRSQSLKETEDVARESQILIGTDNAESRVQKINKKDFNYFREKFLQRDTEAEQDTTNQIKELFKDPDTTQEQREELEGILDAIREQRNEDKKEYLVYREEKKKLDKIEEAKDLENFSFEELVEAARIADKHEAKDAKLRLGVYLNNEGIKRLNEVNPEITEKANTKDFTFLEKWNKVLSNVSEYFPALQQLHKVFEERYLAKVQEMNKIKAKNEKLAKAVIKERNGILGSASDWFTSDSAKYFEFMDEGGKLRTNTAGLTKAQKEYLEFFRDLVSERNEILDEDGNVLDNTLIKIDKGFRETFKDKEYKEAMKLLLPKSQNESLNWNGALTSRFDRPYKGRAYSKDFYKASNLFIEDMAHVKYMKDLVPVVDGIELFYKNVAQEEGRNLNNLIEFVQEWKKSKIYQESGTTDPKIDVPLRVLRGLTSVTTMAWNIPANLMNVFIGNANAIVKDGLENFLKGNKRLATKKGMAILKHYDVIKTDYDSNPKLHVGKALEYLAFAGLRFGETQIQGSQFLGKLSASDMNSFELVDGELKLKDGVDKKSFDQKMIKYRNEVSDVQGKYADKDKSTATNYEFGKALFQFKQWLPAFWKDKFGAEFVNSDNEVKRGTFNYTKKALEELRNDWSDHGVLKGTWKNEQTMSNLKYLAIMAAMTAYLYADDDDEKKKKQALSVDNALHQMMFVFDLQQLKYMVTSPIAAQGPVTKLIDAMIAITNGDEKKLKKNVKKLIPHNKAIDIAESAVK